MKKIITLFPTILLIYFSGFAQFSFHVFPMGVIGDAYADTILNTRAILFNAGVKQIKATQTSPKLTKTFASKTANLNKDGRIEKMTICFATNTNNFTHCVEDNNLYNAAGYMTEMKTTDNAGNKYPLYFAEQINEREITYRQDSIVSYQYYNEKVQLIKLRRIWKEQEVENTLFYYNPDGLLDSTRNTQMGTFVFKRRKKGKRKLIEMENYIASYKWVYDHSGRCISSTFISKDRPNIIRFPASKGNIKTETNYYYNPDGTLSKVTSKSSHNPTTTMYYSYSK